MRYCTRKVSTIYPAISSDAFGLIFKRYASSGLNLWDKVINDEIRHQIETYWSPKICNQKPAGSSKKADNHYVLSMFPYPSGALHMGHVRVYSISDSVSRFHKMRGKNVLHPMGWDAFGLPAENAALERNISPVTWTMSNIARMKSQFIRMGCDFDWSRELKTCDPEYYKWTQVLFLKLYKKHLAYQKESFVNWDPVDKTVLADEQVDEKGCSWRSGAKVEKKLLKQWFIRTSAFSESLYQGLNDPILKEWRDIIKIQKNWIGNPIGTSLDFKIALENQSASNIPQNLDLWTDKPAFVEHIKFIAVSKNSFLTKLEENPGNETFYKLLDVKVINPFTNTEIPVYYTNIIEFPRWRDDFVGIPGACEVANNFWKFLGKQVPQISYTHEVIEKRSQEILAKARELNIGGFKVSNNLRDWLISRQRYWGTPIPIVHCASCGTVPVPEEHLPVLLPTINSDDFKLQNLKNSADFLHTTCPSCGGQARRESDTMDTFVDSSWYFLRYTDPQNTKEMFSKKKAKEFLPVNLYIGGKEHAVLHLYYARFINHFMYSEGLVPTREPFRQLLVQGMVNGRSFRLKGSGQYLKSDNVEKQGNNWVEKSTGMPVVASWEKMSKSKHNGVDPESMFARFGADTTRLIILADVAPTSSRNWTEDTFQGIFNWQKRLWLTVAKFIEIRKTISLEDVGNVKHREKFEENNQYLAESRNFYVKGVTFNIVGSQQLSVAISKMQGFTNSIRKVSLECLGHSKEYEKALATQIIMLAPLAPQFASELWAGFSSAKYHLARDDHMMDISQDVLQQPWPEIDMDYKLDLDIIINGYNVEELKVERRILDNLTAETAAQLAAESPKYRQYVGDAAINSCRFIAEPGCDAKLFFNIEKSKNKMKNTV